MTEYHKYQVYLPHSIMADRWGYIHLKWRGVVEIAFHRAVFSINKGMNDMIRLRNIS